MQNLQTLKSNTQAFSLVEGLVVILLLGAIGGVGSYAYQQNSTDNSSKGASESTKTVNTEKRDDVITLNDVADFDTSKLSPINSDLLEHAKQYRFVTIDQALTDRLLSTNAIMLELFEGVVVELNLTQRTEDDGSLILSSSGDDGSSVFISIKDNQLRGSIYAKTASGISRYDIDHIEGGVHFLYENGKTYPNDGQPVTSSN